MSFVGAGGKTSLLLHLAGELAAADRPVLVTTTTRLADPREEPGGPFVRILLVPGLAEAAVAGSSLAPGLVAGISLVAARSSVPAGKLVGVHPSRVDELRAAWPIVLVEADGSKGLPIKAPAAWEPVVPERTDLVVGVVGLDALGWPMDERTVHRPDRFAAVTGCAPGGPIGWDHLVALARHPEGLFKGSVGRRVILLNKVDESPFLPSPGQLAALGADLVLLSAAEDGGRAFFTARRESAR